MHAPPRPSVDGGRAGHGRVEEGLHRDNLRVFLPRRIRRPTTTKTVSNVAVAVTCVTRVPAGRADRGDFDVTAGQVDQAFDVFFFPFLRSLLRAPPTCSYSLESSPYLPSTFLRVLLHRSIDAFSTVPISFSALSEAVSRSL